MENQPKILERRGPRQSKPMQRPTALNASPMKTNNLSFGNADGEAHADAEAVHAVNQKLQPLRSVREEDNINGIAQEWHTAARQSE